MVLRVYPYALQAYQLSAWVWILNTHLSRFFEWCCFKCSLRQSGRIVTYQCLRHLDRKQQAAIARNLEPLASVWLCSIFVVCVTCYAGAVTGRIQCAGFRQEKLSTLVKRNSQANAVCCCWFPPPQKIWRYYVRKHQSKPFYQKSVSC